MKGRLPTGLPRQRPLLGVTLIALAATCFASMDSSSRLLGQVMPVLLFFWARHASQAATSAMSFYGVQHMPVPEFTAINMLTPLLVSCWPAGGCTRR